MTRVLALVLAPLVGAPAAEFLRALTALCAVGAGVSLVEAGAGIGAFRKARDEGNDDVCALVEALVAEGVEATRADDLAASIADAPALMVLSDPARPGEPQVLRLRRGERPEGDVSALLASAGQVVLE